MLRELKINNLALIEALHLNFSDGLTVLTGETGAGKSIVLQAINLLNGGKTSPAIIRTGADNTNVEALFELSPELNNLKNLLAASGFEAEDTIILKRILNHQGRSRYYINGSLATARLTWEISQNLLTVAGQRDQQQILNPAHHLDFVDTVGNLWPLRQEYTVLYNNWVDLKKTRDDIQKKNQEKKQRRDLLSFQCDEINNSHIIPDEDKILATEKDRLKSADTLTRLGLQSYELTKDTVLDSLALIKKNLEQIVTLDESASSLLENISDVYYQLEDNAEQIRDYSQAIPIDPSRLEEIDERLDLLHGLKRKYGGISGSLEDVISYGENGAEELNHLDNLGEQLQNIESELALIERQLQRKAVKLSNQREIAGKNLQESMQKELLSLCFEQAEFQIYRKPCDPNLASLDETGWDKLEFMFSANPGEPVKPLVSIISGGELSRVMLAFKCLLAKKDMVKTVLFDEVDAGIGGRAAEAVALKIKELATHHQVLCITHLPQIASYADDHFIVSKAMSGERTQTKILRLSENQRATELARMLAGDTVTEKTLLYAEELIIKGGK